MQRYRVEAEAVERLRRRLIPDSQPADAWPTAAPPSLGSPVATTSRAVASDLQGDTGSVVVDFEVADASDAVVTSVGWNFFTTFGTPVPQYRTGELIYPVEVVDAAPGESHYSRSNAAGTFHTDGTFLPTPPDVAALLCLSAAGSGGETVLIEGPRLLADLTARDPRAADVLSRTHHFDCLGQLPGHETRRQPIFSRSENDFVLRYLRRYVEDGYAKVGQDLPRELRDAMDELDELAADEARQDAVRLQRGQMLVFDNRRFLHGRRSFSETTSRRRLRRIYGVFAGGSEQFGVPRPR
jgi:alpha-ketoglutarate-dependent taurine dioxygenase